MLSNIWVWDPGSGRNLFRIPDHGVKKAPDPGSGTLLFILGVPQLAYFCLVCGSNTIYSDPDLDPAIPKALIRILGGFLDLDPDQYSNTNPDPATPVTILIRNLDCFNILLKFPPFGSGF
jgi:hypothetical protein